MSQREHSNLSLRAGTKQPSLGQSVQNPSFRVFMGNTGPGGYLLFGSIDLFQHFQALLHPLVLVNIHEYGNAMASLRQHHATPAILDRR